MMYILGPGFGVAWWMSGLGFLALAAFAVWLGALSVLWLQGCRAELQYRRGARAARRRYDREHDASIAQLDVIHQWSDEVYK